MGDKAHRARKYARVGIATKGIVYLLMGGLAALTATKLNSDFMDSQQVLKWISERTFGRVLLFGMIVGLVGYVISRAILAFNNYDYDHSHGKPWVKRVGYVINGLGYILLCYSSITLLIGIKQNEGKSPFITSMLDSQLGVVLVIIVAAGLAISAINEFYMAFCGLMEDMILKDEMDKDNYSRLLLLGKIGRSARGLVFGCVAYTLFKAAFSDSAGVPGGTTVAFKFLEDAFGEIIMCVVAGGLAMYGLYLIIGSKYRNVPIRSVD
ncbi:DUF1206 domain-containing protein [Nonlabens ponticola]|uniref:DUF1206 domain-containing protein n=1 Tax=Nonlabens ponticola TaxID=2496866 RepID=A0A3S9MZD3_9FLAO|nr:DUF1206 domain-containing protein [Nonlabens ponticola]AZQ44611.1 DUF1206 domain-containing protein [Nonlabens ponticola]